MDRRSRFSPEPALRGDLNAFRTRAASQPPRVTSDAISFTLPDHLSTIHRSAQSPVRDRPFPPGQRLGRSPVVSSRVPAPRSASFSAGHALDNDSWHSGPNIHATFDEDDEESLDTWDAAFNGEPRSWSNSDTRFRSHTSGPRSRSLVTNFANPHPISRDFLSGGSLSTSDWNDRGTNGMHHSIDNRFLHDYARNNGTLSHSLQSATSMPAALANRASAAELSNMSPFMRDRIEEAPYNDHWATLASMREEEETRSGATSRRHSVSVVQPRGRGIVGFSAINTNPIDDEPVYAARGRGTTFSDEELAGDFALLSMHGNGLHGSDPLSPSFPYAVPRVAAQSPPRSRLSAFRAAMDQRPYEGNGVSKPRTPSTGRSPIADSYLPHPSDLKHPPSTRHYRNPSPARPSGSRGPSPGTLASPSMQGPNHWQQESGGHEHTQGVLLEDLPPAARLVMAEFKLNRKELFYHEPSLTVVNGDLLMVEGDRGRDIGRVVQVNIDRNWLSSQRRGVDMGIGSNPHQRAKRAHRLANAHETQYVYSYL